MVILEVTNALNYPVTDLGNSVAYRCFMVHIFSTPSWQVTYHFLKNIFAGPHDLNGLNFEGMPSKNLSSVSNLLACIHIIFDATKTYLRVTHLEVNHIQSEGNERTCTV